MILDEELGDGLRIVRSDGAEMWCSMMSDRGWKVTQDGLDDFVDLDLQVETSPNVLTDGSTLVSKRVGEVERTCEIFYAGDGDPSAVRTKVLAFFNPKYSFEAHVTLMGVTRWCEGELSGVKCVPKPANHPCELTFSLLCLDPYMRGEDGNQNSLTDAAPMFGFPYVSHVREILPMGEKYPVGSLASKMLYDGLNTVYNSGDVPCYYTIRMEARGTVKNPKFTKDDRFVQLVYTFKDGDVLEIDFTKAPPSVTIDGQNSIQRCSRDSNFTGMAMQVGANVFQYECENAENRPYMDVQIRFNKRYLGV